MDNGLNRLRARLEAIPKAVRAAVQPALLKSAEEIAASMRALAPVASGALRDSIAVTGPSRQTPPYSQPGGSHSVPENAAAITAGSTDVRYPHLVEYGTRKSPAQPFFWPAYRLLRTRARRRIKRAMSKAIKESKR